MKLITRDTDYAIRALSCIAASEGRMVTVSHLSDELNIPRPFLRKIFQMLNKVGLLKSFKGKGGGFALVEKPAKITIFNLVEIFQGPFQLSDHTFKGEMCPHIELCCLKGKLDDIERDIVKELKSITIASLVKKGKNCGKRKIIKIDEDKCTGCGDCIPNCPEGALQMIDGKARLISDLFCDGLGACIGHCPEGAITIEEREAEKYDEKKVMENIIRQGPNVIKAHLEHLKEHGEKEYLTEAIEVLKTKNIDIPEGIINIGGEGHMDGKQFSGCPGSRVMDFSAGGDSEAEQETGKRSSQLRQWPVQLHLVPPQAPYFQGKDVVLAADCVAYSVADFHKDFLSGKSLAIACPKLDSDQGIYTEKIIAMIDEAKINTLTVMTMEVPCCTGLLMMAKQAASRAKRKVPLKHIMVGIKGDILKEDWVEAE